MIFKHILDKKVNNFIFILYIDNNNDVASFKNMRMQFVDLLLR